MHKFIGQEGAMELGAPLTAISNAMTLAKRALLSHDCLTGK